jgi:hypothetical protein
MAKNKYRVKPEYIGLECDALSPEYERPGGGHFILNDELPQKDLGYLFEVLGYDGVEVVE